MLTRSTRVNTSLLCLMLCALIVFTTRTHRSHNVLVSSTFGAKVADFGASSRVGQVHSNLYVCQLSEVCACVQTHDRMSIRPCTRPHIRTACLGRNDGQTASGRTTHSAMWPGGLK